MRHPYRFVRRPARSFPRSALTPRSPVPRLARMSFEADVAVALREAAAVAGAFDFEAWALRVFAHQYAHIDAYRAFCDRRGVTPATIARADDVPAVPTRVFRSLELATGPAEAVFRTSGTSGGPDARG